MKLKEITPGLSLTGIEPTQIVSVVATVPLGDEALQLIYRTPDGGMKERLLGSADEASISVATVERPFSFDGDGAAFQLACEAKRIDLAFLFDPMMAVHTSNVDPLPHQITAVYESMLPRLKDRAVLAQAIRSGAASRDFFGTAYGQNDGKFDGFQFDSENVQLDDTLLLIEPEAANKYEADHRKPMVTSPEATGAQGQPPAPEPTATGTLDQVKATGEGSGSARPRSFHGTVEVSAATAKMRLVQIAEEIVSVLVSDPNASVKVVVEISAEFPDGAKDQLKRAVSENARSLGIKIADWE